MVVSGCFSFIFKMLLFCNEVRIGLNKTLSKLWKIDSN